MRYDIGIYTINKRLISKHQNCTKHYNIKVKYKKYFNYTIQFLTVLSI